MRLRANAKINLSLKILGKRPDGYHEIDSIMQSVSLCDYITLAPLESGIQLTTNNLRLTTDNRNLAYEAAEVFFSAKGQDFDELSRVGARVKGIKIYLEKNIPLAAGLAGGSTDAAAVLYGLNQLSAVGDRLSAFELQKLGAEIGSDVPFCLTGGNCTVTGRGEFVKSNPINVKRDFVLVVPEVEVSTKWAYEAWDSKQATGNRQLATQNDLEAVVIEKYPVIQKIKDRLIELGCSYAQMSGSGPSVFGIVNLNETGNTVYAQMKNEYPRTFLVRSADRGIEEG